MSDEQKMQSIAEYIGSITNSTTHELVMDKLTMDLFTKAVDLRPNAIIMLPHRMLSQLLISTEFSSWFDPISEITKLEIGCVGSLLGLMIVTDAYADADHKFLENPKIVILNSKNDLDYIDSVWNDPLNFTEYVFRSAKLAERAAKARGSTLVIIHDTNKDGLTTVNDRNLVVSSAYHGRGVRGMTIKHTIVIGCTSQAIRSFNPGLYATITNAMLTSNGKWQDV